jgi:hypothetical protein
MHAWCEDGVGVEEFGQVRLCDLCKDELPAVSPSPAPKASGSETPIPDTTPSHCAVKFDRPEPSWVVSDVYTGTMMPMSTDHLCKLIGTEFWISDPAREAELKNERILGYKKRIREVICLRSFSTHHLAHLITVVYADRKRECARCPSRGSQALE